MGFFTKNRRKSREKKIISKNYSKEEENGFFARKPRKASTHRKNGNKTQIYPEYKERGGYLRRPGNIHHKTVEKRAGDARSRLNRGVGEL